MSDHPRAYLKPIGESMQHWHAGQADPVYAVGSFFFDEKDYPELSVVFMARRNLSQDLEKAQAGKHGWGPEEVKELEGLIAFLDSYMEKRKESA